MYISTTQYKWNPANSNLVNSNPPVTQTRSNFLLPIFWVIYYQLTQICTNSTNFCSPTNSNKIQSPLIPFFSHFLLARNFANSNNFVFLGRFYCIICCRSIPDRDGNILIYIVSISYQNEKKGDNMEGQRISIC